MGRGRGKRGPGSHAVRPRGPAGVFKGKPGGFLGQDGGGARRLRSPGTPGEGREEGRGGPLPPGTTRTGKRTEGEGGAGSTERRRPPGGQTPGGQVDGRGGGEVTRDGGSGRRGRNPVWPTGERETPKLNRGERGEWGNQGARNEKPGEERPGGRKPRGVSKIGAGGISNNRNPGERGKGGGGFLLGPPLRAGFAGGLGRAAAGPEVGCRAPPLGGAAPRRAGGAGGREGGGPSPQRGERRKEVF